MNFWKNISRKHPDLIAISGIAVITFLLFARAIPFAPSSYDDAFYIGQHELLRLNAENLRYWFTHQTLRLYSPLAMYSYMADLTIWSPARFHIGIRIQSLLWHITAAAFFYGLLRLLQFRRNDGETVTLNPLSAFLTTLIFSLHPQRIESVVWLSERKDVLMAALGLAALYFFLKAHRKNRTSIAAPLLLFLSFGTKPMLVTLPCVMALLLWSQERKIDCLLWFKRLAPSVAAVTAYFFLNSLQVGSSLAGGAEPDKLRFLRVLWNMGNYFTRVYLPCDLQVIYPLFDPQLFFPWRGILLAGTILFLLILGASRQEYRASLYGGVLPCLFAYAGTLFPVSGIVSIGNTDCADRYSYFPSVFLCILTGFIMQLLWNKFPRYRKIIPGVCLFYTAVLALQTHYLLDSWRSFRHHLAAALDTPSPPRSVLYQAVCFATDNGQQEERLLFLRQLREKSAPAQQRTIEQFDRLTAGVLLFQQKKADQGIRELDAVYSAPDWDSLRLVCYGMFKKGLLLAAGYHQKHNHPAAAAALFRKAADAAMETDVIESECYSGIAALLSKEFTEAEQHFQNALRYAPDDRNIRANLKTVRMLKACAAQQKEAVKK